MELQEFVVQALVQIVSGIVDAQGKVAAAGGAGEDSLGRRCQLRDGPRRGAADGPRAGEIAIVVGRDTGVGSVGAERKSRPTGPARDRAPLEVQVQVGSGCGVEIGRSWRHYPMDDTRTNHRRLSELLQRIPAFCVAAMYPGRPWPE